MSEHVGHTSDLTECERDLVVHAERAPLSAEKFHVLILSIPASTINYAVPY